jgi:hypothetical protein
MTDQDIGSRLASAMRSRAADAATATDTATALERLEAKLPRQNRRRRVLLAGVATGAAAGTALAVAAATGLLSPAPQVSSAVQPGPPPGPARVVPLNFPTGLLAVPNSPDRASMVVNESGSVQFRADVGTTHERVSFPHAGTVVFEPESFFCSTAGTYRYTVTHGALRFGVVSDTCASRRGFLTEGPFVRP